MTAKTTTSGLKLVNYVRVSTKRQGVSGLGLEGQMKAVAEYAASVGGTAVATYREVESGKNASRPELAKAIAHAKRIKGRLLIAKLDRLSRSVHFTSGLQEAKVDFVACDAPHANTLMINIMVSFAQHEAEAISLRTKAALAAAKARGTLLGTHREGHYTGTTEQHREAAAMARKAAAVAHHEASAPLYAEVRPIIETMKADGHSLREIAAKLNEQGFTTLRGSEWNPVQVSRLAC
jgi:DNA invertase Pin-like site-specific DNA recombinase